MKLTPEDLCKLQTKQVANIIRKLGEGKTLTAREQQILDQESAAGAAPGTTGNSPQTSSAFVGTQEELADLCDVDRKTIGNVIRKYPKLLPGKKRGAESDGRYNVEAWKTLLVSLGIQGRGLNNPDLDDERAIRLDLLKIERDQKQFNLDKARESMLALAQFEAALARTKAAFLAAVNAFGPRVNEQLEGLDFNDRAAVLENEADLLRKTLATCDYLALEKEEDGGSRRWPAAAESFGQSLQPFSRRHLCGPHSAAAADHARLGG